MERARIITLTGTGWLHRFNAAGLDGLDDRPGAGRRRRITEVQRSAIIALARSVPPGRLDRDGAGEPSTDDERGQTQWTLDTLAQAARDASIRVGRSQVRWILLAEKVRWRRTRSWAASTDPEFVPKGPGSRLGRITLELTRDTRPMRSSSVGQAQRQRTGCQDRASS